MAKVTRFIGAYKYGICEICKEDKPTVEFEEENMGFEGWLVNFEICKECFLNKLKEVEE